VVDVVAVGAEASGVEVVDVVVVAVAELVAAAVEVVEVVVLVDESAGVVEVGAGLAGADVVGVLDEVAVGALEPGGADGLGAVAVAEAVDGAAGVVGVDPSPVSIGLVACPLWLI
jgi:hypothetical protein